MKNLGKYFDYAAATPMDPRVLRDMQPYFTDEFYNPSALYEPARKAASELKELKSRAAKILGTKSTEIIFTAGGTEANNLAIYGVMTKFTDGNIVFSAIEHESVIVPGSKFNHKICPVSQTGFVGADKLAKLIDDKTVLVSIMLTNNEIGTIQPIKQISEEIRKIRVNRLKSGNKTPLFLHTDASQATNYLDLQVARLGVDLLTLNGGKIYGPKQSGLLFIKTGVILEPLILGGGQERGLRSGTESMANIAGLVKALEITERMKKAELNRLLDLQKIFVDELEKQIKNYQINGSLKNRLPNNIHVTIFGQDNERLMMSLDLLGFQVAVGSACSASSEEPSHVLTALGMSESDIRSSLRFTIGRFTKAEDIKTLVKSLKNSVRA